jgi:tetrahydromethanopterin S-methyltransferase subunit G
MRKVKGTGQWAGKTVPGMYQDGGEPKKNILKNSRGDISVKKTGVKKGPDISVKPGGKSTSKQLEATTKRIKKVGPEISKKTGKKVGKRIAKQIAKKLGPIGVAYTVYDVLKDPKGALDQLKTDYKNVKNFIKGNKGKSETPKKTTTKKRTTPKKKDTKLESMKKGEYTPQSQRK